MTDTRFVLQNGRKTDDPKTRTLIRRHVMLGKNQGRARIPQKPMLPGCAVFPKDDREHSVQSTRSEIPRRVGTDLSFLEFADAVEPSIMNDTLRFCSATNEKLFLLEPCISFNSTDIADTCVESLASDPLHLNIMVFAALAYMHQLSWQANSEPHESPSKAIPQHYGQALSLLRKRLADAERKRCGVSDWTVTSVVTLATHALFTGDVESATNHVAGLSKLVSMKENGKDAFKGKTKQMIEILRCDLSVSLASGQMPLFFSDSFQEPIFPLPALVSQSTVPGRCPITTDEDLSKIWHALSQFCTTINEVAVDSKKVSDQLLLETMASVMYRLLHMSFTPGSTEEITRLALVSFCASTLLPFRQLRMPFGWLRLKYKRSLAIFMRSSLRFRDPEVTLWFVMTYIVAFSPLIADESGEVRLWLKEASNLGLLTTWDDVKRIVGEFLWIDVVCDFWAEKFVEETLPRRLT